ncbi:pseudouridine synthase [Floricoccus tropicus]|uniref:Pseudouridine synthase n=2 Tax=Floricoccus TaxID=1930830 RepID=A0A1E8GP64_9LACT|nr:MULTISPECIES: pseudouridine synthase [Floricoccus]OFI47759.1 pseudouridine synthase [Floricoccus penangensis]OFI49403.1 pseudouridine synthase [Floricoccus tropicus]URZ88224.1 rRNA pseudouridine synthase [Floricoccus penangensis]
MRINKYLAHAGIASRRKAEELIKSGQVQVNGKMMTDLAYQVKAGDRVEVDGISAYSEEPVYFLFNKPRGVISSVSDEKGRKTVMDYFHGVKERIYPVGRLDWDTSGLLLMTNDGEFANLMTHPRHEVEKVYVAKVEGQANKENLRPLTHGVRLDGRKTKPATYSILKTDGVKKTSVVSLVIHEGRNHQVKKMFEAVGLPVQKLSRVQYGPLDLAGVAPGEYRKLSKKEVSQLVNMAKND